MMSPIFSGPEIVAEFQRIGVSHVVWIPDSSLGIWESALESSPMQLLRICREGEAWPLAAGLLLGGLSPLVVMQTTGLFESGDALRNVIHDLRLPVFGLIGARSWRQPVPDSSSGVDSAQRFAVPILKAWEIDYVVIESRDDQARFEQQYRKCQQAKKPGMVLLAE